MKKYTVFMMVLLFIAVGGFARQDIGKKPQKPKIVAIGNFEVETKCISGLSGVEEKDTKYFFYVIVDGVLIQSDLFDDINLCLDEMENIRLFLK